MSVSKIPKTVFSLVEPAVWALAARLLILTTGRKGSVKYQPTVGTFYETGVVTEIYEALLMCPLLAHIEIRHEFPIKVNPGRGAPQQIDLWLRPHNGGRPTMIEVGDFSVQKVHADLGKLARLNPDGTNWFLALFRSPSTAGDPWAEIERCRRRSRSPLDPQIAKAERRLTKSFKVYRPVAEPEDFGVALLRGQ